MMTLFSAGQDRLEFDWKRHNRKGRGKTSVSLSLSLCFFFFFIFLGVYVVRSMFVRVLSMTSRQCEHGDKNKADKQDTWIKKRKEKKPEKNRCQEKELGPRQRAET